MHLERYGRAALAATDYGIARVDIEVTRTILGAYLISLEDPLIGTRTTWSQC